MAPQRHTGLMPCTWQNGVFALRAIYGEEVEWLVIGVGQSERYYNMAGTNVQKTPERLLNPELLKFNLTAALLFLLKLNGLFCFVFYCRTGTAMLEFNLSTKAPTLTEVVTEIYNGMGYVETSMAWIVLATACRTVAVA